jgi:hypothetical protein
MQGSSRHRDDAVLFACGANAQHGLPRSRSDKGKAVTTLLSSETWSAWSDREIARRCGVSHGFVAAIRRDHLDTLPDAGRAAEEAGAADAAPAPDRPRTVTRGGRHYNMNTARIGRGRPGRRNKVARKPKLNSLAWSEADARERARFIAAVGRDSVEHALEASQPPYEITRLDHTFRRFERALRSASEPARRTFLEQYRDEIIALTRAVATPIAVADLASATAPLARAQAEGGDGG